LIHYILLMKMPLISLLLATLYIITAGQIGHLAYSQTAVNNTELLPIPDHGQEVSIMLDSARFIPLTTGGGNQVNVLVNYTVNDPSIINSPINSVMKVYWPNRTLFKTSSSPEGFIANETGTQRHATTITNSKLVDPIAVVQFTNLAKTVPISNPVQVRLNLNQPAATTTTTNATTTIQGTATNEIAALPP
jgi:hypothetical protein